MLTLQTNVSNLYGRIITLAILLLLVCLFGNKIFEGLNTGQVLFKIDTWHLEFKAFSLLIPVFCLFPFVLILTIFSINKDVVDKAVNSITFITYLGKSTISIIDIEEYFDTIHSKGYKEWYGLIIITKDNKSIQVAGQNIESLSDLKDYLDEKKIDFAGQKNMAFPFN